MKENIHLASTVCLQDPKLVSELESRGNGSLEQRTITICFGLDFVTVTHNNFVARDEDTANVRHYNYCIVITITSR